MKKPSKPKVTIGIPAHDEEKNIKSVLLTLLTQSKKKYKLSSIDVYADGCKDDTPVIVKNVSVKHNKVKLINDGKHFGKIGRLNMMFNSCTSDILIILDADLQIKDNEFIDKLVTSIMADDKTMMVTANPIPIEPRNFIGKVIYAQSIMWDFVRLSIPNYDHVHNFYGPATAYRGSYAKGIHIPAEVKEQRIYLYLKAKQLDGFKYCFNACFYYQQVTSISDLVKLSTRSFGKKQPEIDKIFDCDVSKYYDIPFKYKLKGLVHSIRWNAPYTICALLMTEFLNLLKIINRNSRPRQWEIVKTSKISYA